jgi:hypothetical protein
MSWSLVKKYASDENIFGFLKLGNTVLGSIAKSGILRSGDNGATWQDFTNGLNVSGVLLKQVGTVTYAASYRDGLIFTSMDSGSTWKYLGGFSRPWDYAVLDSDLFATEGVGGGMLWHSRLNDASHWTFDTTKHVTSFAVYDNKIFIGGSDTCCGKIYMSTNHGNSWIDVTSNFAAGMVTALFINDKYLYAGTALHPWRRPLSNFSAVTQMPEGKGISIYPNPASSELTIECSEAKSVSISDALSREIASFKPNGESTQYDVSQLANGVYYCTVQSATGRETRKFVVSH